MPAVNNRTLKETEVEENHGESKQKGFLSCLKWGNLHCGHSVTKKFENFVPFHMLLFPVTVLLTDVLLFVLLLLLIVVVNRNQRM